MKLLRLAMAMAIGFSGSALAATSQTVEVRFAATIGEAAFRCGETYPGIGVPAASIRPTDFRFYVMDAALIDHRGRLVPIDLEQDGLWQYRDIALLDFEDGSGPCRGGNEGLNVSIKGKVPKGRYVGLRFDVGLPFELNHGDASIAPSPLNFTSMFWAWQVGYRFLKVDLEGVAKADGGRQTGFSIHIGSTGCDGPSLTERPRTCENPNRINVRFDRFDPRRDVVIADLAAMLAGTDTSRNTPNTAPGCMSAPDDPDCRAVFAGFGLALGDQPAGPQKIFRRR